jgi:hypothetical protein
VKAIAQADAVDTSDAANQPQSALWVGQVKPQVTRA